MQTLLSVLYRVLQRLNAAIALLVKGIVVLLGLGMTLSILYQVFMRYVFNSPPSWSEELALLFFSWSMLLMLAVGVREAFHVRMDLILNWLPRLGNQLLERFIDLCTAAFGGYLAWMGVEYCLMMVGSTSAAIAYPITMLYSAAPVSGVLIFLFSLELLFDPRRLERSEGRS
ncbi:TRAP transporter small permease [Orrella marina]|uniref:TRAP transporter small permease protein n=1 Tax=Orrella marina TaxID=2163011 RepID=A0A2R4XGP9_9BURK|nr:TRAP transporter small permease [Orrella marina]AWB32987.1 TRAP transporter small permease [Orrella marina]